MADLEIEETTGRIRKIYGVWEAERLPVGVTVRKGVPDREMCIRDSLGPGSDLHLEDRRPGGAA